MDQEAQRDVQVGAPDAGVQLPAELRRATRHIIASRPEHVSQPAVLGLDELSLGGTGINISFIIYYFLEKTNCDSTVVTYSCK